MALHEINWTPTEKELRQFAGLFLGIFGAVGCYMHFWRGVETWGAVLAVVAVLVGVAGLARPALVKPIFVGWLVAAFPIGWTISHLLLGAIYYLVLTPIGMVLRAVGYDPMNRELDEGASTYWSTRSVDTDVKRYFRQF